MQTKQNAIALIWFRNDLRVNDNEVLKEAMQSNKEIIGIYCFDPRHYKATAYGFKKTEKFRAKFLLETISDLKKSLSLLNIHLLVFNDKPETVIPKLVEKYSIERMYLQNEWTTEEVEILRNVRKAIPSGLQITEVYNQFLYHPEDIQMEFGNLPKVFTDFRKQLENQIKVRNAIATPKAQCQVFYSELRPEPTLKNLGFDDFESHPHTAFPFKGGETAAVERLQDYFFQTKKLGFYKKTRNGLIGTDFSSKFSPWIANGSLSPRTIYWEVKRFEAENFKNDSTYWLIFELIWRDYFKYVSLKHGSEIFLIGGILHKNYDWITEPKALKQWQNGTTAEPFVNANMIELNKTGWMSNRGRQNVASYFAKTLNLDWRIGAAYFESLLIDYDVHSNYGNWMYVSGVGNDPRDRTFNVKLQAERYDANGKYQKLWLQDTLF